MDLVEKEISRECVYQGPIFSVNRMRVQLPDGRTAQRDVVENADAVCVAALDEQNSLLMVRQFRIAVGRILTELPAGKLNPGEDPKAGALRELEEETGCIPGKMRYLFGLRMTPGCVTETIHCFLAQDLHFGQTHPDDGEYLEILHMPLQEAVDKAMTGQLEDAKTVATVLAVERILQTEAER